jgi:hypothetical protein
MTIAKKEIRIDMQSNPATQVGELMQASQDVFVVGSYMAMIILKKISRLPKDNCLRCRSGNVACRLLTFLGTREVPDRKKFLVLALSHVRQRRY